MVCWAGLIKSELQKHGVGFPEQFPMSDSSTGANTAQALDGKLVVGNALQNDFQAAKMDAPEPSPYELLASRVLEKAFEKASCNGEYSVVLAEFFKRERVESFDDHLSELWNDEKGKTKLTDVLDVKINTKTRKIVCTFFDDDVAKLAAETKHQAEAAQAAETMLFVEVFKKRVDDDDQRQQINGGHIKLFLNGLGAAAQQRTEIDFSESEVTDKGRRLRREGVLGGAHIPADVTHAVGPSPRFSDRRHASSPWPTSASRCQISS